MTDTLSNIIRKNGFTYIKVLEGVKSCIYKQVISEKEGIYNYEVFTKKTKPARIINNKLLPSKIMFPCNSVFGKWAWCFTSFKDAIFKFNKLEGNNILSYYS